MDKTLKQKLFAEANGIVAWLVRGAMDYYQKESLPEPQSELLSQ